MDYGLKAYSTAADTQIQRLELIQNFALRIITGLKNGTKISPLQCESNFISIRYYINFLLCKTSIKFLHLPKFHI